MSRPEESVVLCEGFHDRAFWKGWLLHLRCEDARPRRDSGYGIAVDPFGRKVTNGHFAFRSPAGAFIRVRPCVGDQEVLKQTEIRLEERKTQALRRLVINLDTDDDDGGVEPHATSLRQAIESRVAATDPAMIRLAGGDLSIDSGSTLISIVLWRTDEPRVEHLPGQQTLERLVCAALCGAYPDRATAVAAWLTSRPSAPLAGPKEHAWSHMAGWYGEHGCDDFYQSVWRDPAVAAQLEQRLRASGGYRVAEELVR